MDTFIYSGIWHKQHDTLYLFKQKTKHVINGKNANIIVLHAGCETQMIVPFFGPWSSINLLFIDKTSYIQKIVFPLENKDYWSKTYNANTITKEKLNLTFQIFPNNR